MRLFCQRGFQRGNFLPVHFLIRLQRRNPLTVALLVRFEFGDAAPQLDGFGLVQAHRRGRTRDGVHHWCASHPLAHGHVRQRQVVRAGLVGDSDAGR